MSSNNDSKGPPHEHDAISAMTDRSRIRRLMWGGFIGDVLHIIAYVYGVGEGDEFEELLLVRLYPAVLEAR